MKTVGMIGGMSWESTAVYYRILNQEILKRCDGAHAARALLHSFDFGEMSKLQHAGRWQEADARMVQAAQGLERSGADFLIICCNTMHLSTPAIERAVHIPLLHIADPLGKAMETKRIRKPALLGSCFTMEREDIVRGRLKARFGFDVVAPDGADAELIDDVITRELVLGRLEAASRKAYAEIIARLVNRGADGVIMGCTEIPLLLKPEDSAVPLFDTTALHAMAAVDYMLS